MGAVAGHFILTRSRPACDPSVVPHTRVTVKLSLPGGWRCPKVLSLLHAVGATSPIGLGGSIYQSYLDRVAALIPGATRRRVRRPSGKEVEHVVTSDGPKKGSRQHASLVTHGPEWFAKSSTPPFREFVRLLRTGVIARNNVFHRGDDALEHRRRSSARGSTAHGINRLRWD